jgi:hypothetical protein
MNKEDLKQYKMHPQRVKQLTGVNAELYVFTFHQLQEVVNNLYKANVIKCVGNSAKATVCCNDCPKYNKCNPQ